MDLVLREDFEVQRKLLEQAHARSSATLEARVAELEAAQVNAATPALQALLLGQGEP